MTMPTSTSSNTTTPKQLKVNMLYNHNKKPTDKLNFFKILELEGDTESKKEWIKDKVNQESYFFAEENADPIINKNPTSDFKNNKNYIICENKVYRAANSIETDLIKLDLEKQGQQTNHSTKLSPEVSESIMKCSSGRLVQAHHRAKMRFNNILNLYFKIFNFELNENIPDITFYKYDKTDKNNQIKSFNSYYEVTLKNEDQYKKLPLKKVLEVLQAYNFIAPILLLENSDPIFPYPNGFYFTHEYFYSTTDLSYEELKRTKDSSEKLSINDGIYFCKNRYNQGNYVQIYNGKYTDNNYNCKEIKLKFFPPLDLLFNEINNDSTKSLEENKIYLSKDEILFKIDSEKNVIWHIHKEFKHIPKCNKFLSYDELNELIEKYAFQFNYKCYQFINGKKLVQKCRYSENLTDTKIMRPETFFKLFKEEKDNKLLKMIDGTIPLLVKLKIGNEDHSFYLVAEDKSNKAIKDVNYQVWVADEDNATAKNYKALLEEISNDRITADNVAKCLNAPINQQPNCKLSDNMVQLIAITQIAESNSNRTYGMNKLARSAFREIADGKKTTTFKDVFTPSNSNKKYIPVGKDGTDRARKFVSYIKNSKEEINEYIKDQIKPKINNLDENKLLKEFGDDLLNSLKTATKKIVENIKKIYPDTFTFKDVDSEIDSLLNRNNLTESMTISNFLLNSINGNTYAYDMSDDSDNEIDPDEYMSDDSDDEINL